MRSAKPTLADARDAAPRRPGSGVRVVQALGSATVRTWRYFQERRVKRRVRPSSCRRWMTVRCRTLASRAPISGAPYDMDGIGGRGTRTQLFISGNASLAGRRVPAFWRRPVGLCGAGGGSQQSWGLPAKTIAYNEPISPLPMPSSGDPLRIALGARLFADPRLSHDNSRSCTTCHDVQDNGATRRGARSRPGRHVAAPEHLDGLQCGRQLSALLDGQQPQLRRAGQALDRKPAHHGIDASRSHRKARPRPPTSGARSSWLMAGRRTRRPCSTRSLPTSAPC